MLTDPNKARRFHDYAATILVIGGNAIGLGAAAKIYPERISEMSIALWLSIAVAMVSVVLLLITPKWSYKPETSL